MEQLEHIADRVIVAAEDSAHPRQFGGSGTCVGTEVEQAAARLAELLPSLSAEARTEAEDVLRILRERGSWAQDYSNLVAGAAWWRRSVTAAGARLHTVAAAERDA